MKRMVITMDSHLEHHERSGNTYRIDRRLERRGNAILLDRSFVSHAETAGFRSLLLPEQHLWVIFYEAHRPPHPMYCYMHMARICDEGSTVTIEDLYLDVILYDTGRWRVVDIDEFREAVAAGELSPEQIQAALLGLENACRLVDQHGKAMEAFLHAALAVKA